MLIFWNILLISACFAFQIFIFSSPPNLKVNVYIKRHFSRKVKGVNTTVHVYS
jgi:hypothetical protein